ncbi:MAG: SpoIIE family protein phosphatase [Chitinivibrionia bacterium]|nr:SpoIIE family protein phosphatase [Chitinivibrionia bacterium]
MSIIIDKKSTKNAIPREKGFISVRFKIISIVLGFFFVLVLAFAWYSHSAISDYKNLRLENVRKEVEFETEAVNKVIAKIGQSALFAASGAKMALECKSRSLGERIAYQIMKNTEVAIGVGFWFEPSRFDSYVRQAGVYAFIGESGEIEMEDFTLVENNYNYFNSGWYIEIARLLQRPNEVVWTRPYIDDSGTFALMVTAGAGVFDEYGTLVALSTVDWRISEVIEKLIAIKPSEGSFAVLSDPEKDFIISNTLTMNCEGDELSVLPLDINAETFELNGKSYITFSRFMDNGWLLSIHVPAKEIFAEIETHIKMLAMIKIFVALIMLFCVYWLIAVLVNKPIARLISDVNELGGGNLDKRIKITSKDEIGMLAAAFNKMAVELDASIKQNAKEQAEKERISTELDIAMQIQKSVLPRVSTPFQNCTGFDIYANMLPAKEVSGDFYDFFWVNSDTLGVVIADVFGKGIPSVLFMMIARILIRNNAQAGKQPKEVFEFVNNLLCETNDAGMFATVFMGYLDTSNGKLTFVNAGHNPPLLRSKGKYDYLGIKRSGFVFAGMQDTSYAQNEVILHSDDELFLYTDGVTEALNAKNEPFGDERLLKILNDSSGLPLKDLVEKTKNEIKKFADGAEQSDDITILVLRFKGAK